MTRLNISFHAHVPTLHPSVLMTLLSVLSVLRLFGISVTLAPPSLKDLDPSHVLTTLSPILSDEAKRALNIANLGPNHLVANLAPALSDDAKAALTNANINPAAAVASLAPALTDEAARVLNQAHIDPADAVAHVAPANLSADLDKVLGGAVTNYHTPAAVIGLASPFHAAADTIVANGLPDPTDDETLSALTHATTEMMAPNSSPGKASTEQTAGLRPGAAVTTMHNDISAQVSKGSLSKEGALAAHAALYNLVSPKTPNW